ncbi:cobalt/nickel transport protein [Caldanaerobius fijiensis DSM 17918]|uniref:Cobalt transport protein CbiN n=1 Tax=Caldanaerobius fijiensis DSM 17918 TaxID=1121256 RepID=A0A1M4YLG5_9THEO|nr:energy-coupling factor ABC transporter substrate-binding protein [Caldanaerobius fijiensis]SHF06614.1 cobalt/nickel transport protein [Caldanaerobius fijiensis DSM 17918]
MKSSRKFFIKNLSLVLLVIGIAVFPLITLNNAKFTGSDDKAEQMITSIDKTYKPWFKPIWEPPSSEIESLLFSLQAAVGAGFIGYYIGLTKGRKEDKKSAHR